MTYTPRTTVSDLSAPYLGRRRILAVIGIGGLTVMAGCGATSGWQVAYPQPINATEAQGWRITKVTVDTPTTLTTSEENSFTPDYDVVWHGDPVGDRRAQVSALMTTALEEATASLKGRRAVTLHAVMQQFHALTPKTETYATFSGVHDIKFTLEVRDARTGKPLTAPTLIQADAPALVGANARAARERGYTQKREVIDNVVRVLKGYFSLGPDPRGSFSRLGR